MKADESGRAMQAALRLLGGRDYTAGELRKKLNQRDFSPEAVSHAISECRRSGYVNDAAFAERFIAGQARRGFGRHRIRMAMQRKGFDAELIDASLREHMDDASEVKAIRDLATKHKRMSKPLESPIREQQRLYRFLRNRGYPDESIRRAIGDDGLDAG